MYNQTILVGNLGNNPEFRHTPSGVPVANFSIATTKKWVDQNGQKQEKTTWWRVSCWRKLAETVNQYCTKGQQVLVIGEDVEARAYMNRDGEPAAALEITAVTVKFLGKKGDNDEPTGPATATQAVKDAPGADEDVPF